jgi:hypothetical protein
MGDVGSLDLVINQGEDWTVQIQLLDNLDNPKPLVAPARMDIKDKVGTTIHSLVTPEELDPPEEIPSIAISAEVGILQLHIPHAVTNEFPPGSYAYDLWTTIDDGGEYAGPQVQPEIRGTVHVIKRVTEAF